MVEVIRTEVRAAHNVVEACSQTDAMEKVVFISSPPPSSGGIISIRFSLWPELLKTQAEGENCSGRAWQCRIIIGMVPDLSIRNPYLKGAAEMYENGWDAHICVYEDISTNGWPVDIYALNHVIAGTEDAVKLAKFLIPSA
ncbi:uncharacterized protein [Coffea arabica]|uniref:Uncharacterized protein n=1 Tax=Coffea arabica TaxID=13443 RepID=A0ABM4VEL4_COFAR